MAKLNARRALEDYKSSNNDFFKLEDDMDTAVVRFLYENEDDLDTYACHEVELRGKKRYVECLQTGDCPLCLESANDKELKVKVKFFLQLVDERDGKIKTWDRGQKFIPKILGMFNKYGPLVNRPYEVERHGKARDNNTTYELYALDKDDLTLEDFDEKQELIGELVLQWTADQMDAWLNGEDPTGGEEQQEERTPARGGSNRQSSGRDTGRAGSGASRGGSSGSARGGQSQGRGADRAPAGGAGRAGGRDTGGSQRGGSAPAGRGGNASSGRGGGRDTGGSTQGGRGNQEPVKDEDVF